MDRRPLLVSLATVALAVSAVACTPEPEDALAGHQPDSRPVAAAGGTSGASSDAVQELTIVTRDAMRFEPSRLTVVAGRPVRLTVRNGGSSEHDFTLAQGAGQPVKIAVEPGQTTSATFTVARP